MQTLVVIRGVGDIASAVAYLLHRKGHRAILVEPFPPLTTRRRMAFSDAWFDGSAELLNVRAERVSAADELEQLSEAVIPLWAADLESLLGAVAADCLVDARMRKRERAEGQRGLAPLVIGLGPGFEAGKNVDRVIETAHGDELGRIIEKGAASDYNGQPREVAGTRRERHVRAKDDGVFEARASIGDEVKPGEVVAAIDGELYVSNLRGTIRGMLRDGLTVRPGTRLVEITPAAAEADYEGISRRPRRIAEAVIEVLRRRDE